ncbi:hypothetical protein DPMN_029951 [Dreissena polymorpha]|uniref:Uncharacterized protein n=1 Tax=Dreissena polymorpha TaxID=45954 RepID=A0A9D4LY58_DREPO|nr:hypothetical protein DPMN_029951 [Dreissena polymorpha]
MFHLTVTSLFLSLITHQQVRFTSYSGGKSNLENFAYLPTTIMNVVNGTPEYAQWNYR